MILLSLILLTLVLTLAASDQLDQFKSIGNYYIANPSPTLQFQLPGNVFPCFAKCTSLGSDCVFMTVASSSWCSIYSISSVVYSIQLVALANTTLWKKLGSASIPPIYVWTTSYDSQLVHYWPFQSSTTYDLINGANLTSAGSPSWTSDRSGNSNSAIRIDPNTLNTYFNIPSGYYMNAGGSFSVVLWIRVFSCPTFMRVIELSDAARAESFLFTVQATNCMPFVEFFIGSSASAKVDLRSTQSLNSSWSQLAATFDSTIGNLKIYYNAVLSVSSNTTYRLSNVLRTVNYLGTKNPNVETLDGEVDEIKFYNRVLSQSELSSDYAKSDSYLIPFYL